MVLGAERDETVEALLRRWPQALPVFLHHHMACPGCPMAAFETVEEVCRVYRVPLETFLQELAEAGDVRGDVPAG